jgi:hypothetical protein
MYFEDRERYGYFEKVFKQIQSFSVAKNYFSSDLFNIEEILSILQMSTQLSGARSKRLFVSFLSDVVDYWTPVYKPYAGKLPANWEDFLAGGTTEFGSYCDFVGALQSLELTVDRGQDPPSCTRAASPRATAQYGVITLNYDRVLEKAGEYLAATVGLPAPISFSTSIGATHSAYGDQIALAKLHGSVGTKTIVAPTWSKGVEKAILPAWQIAYRLLVEANHIRVIGYSLPVADAYVKYLLKTAVIAAPHLKSLDVVCLDPDGSVKRRFDEFTCFHRYRFFTCDVRSYLGAVTGKRHKQHRGTASSIDFGQLEQAHWEFTQRHPTAK